MSEKETKLKIGEIKLIPTKVFLNNPVAFSLLMEFQYGEMEVAREAEKVLFSGSIEGVIVKNMEEMGLVIPELDFWGDMSKKWQEKEELPLKFYANKSIDSRIAAKYLEQEGFKFEIVELNRENVDVGYGKVKLPVLVKLWTNKDESPYCKNCYASLVGIKDFISRELLKKLGKDPWDYRFVIKTFYSLKKEVTCFDEKGKKIYVGRIEKAPHPIKKPLAEHGYEGWYEVGSWEIGDWKRLLENLDKNNKMINLETRTVLFLDDIEKLKKREEVIRDRHGGCGEVTYEVYFRAKDKLYRLYAHMLD